MSGLIYNKEGLARRSEKQFPTAWLFLFGDDFRGNLMEIKLCECGCGMPTPIAKRTRTSRGQLKGSPLRFINGHNSRLLDSEEQRRRCLFRDPDALRYTGSPLNYVKYKGRHMHRVVAEIKLGRPLERTEVVHHKDHNKWNNHPDNLEVMTQAEHARIHCNIRWGNSVE